MKKVKAAEQLEKMNKNELKKLMAEKGLDNSGFRKRTLVKRICQSEHDPVKMLGELGGTVTQAGDRALSVLDKDALTVEMAEYFKKTVSELAFRWAHSCRLITRRLFGFFKNRCLWSSWSSSPATPSGAGS